MYPNLIGEYSVVFSTGVRSEEKAVPLLVPTGGTCG